MQDEITESLTLVYITAGRKLSDHKVTGVSEYSQFAGNATLEHGMLHVLSNVNRVSNEPYSSWTRKNEFRLMAPTGREIPLL